MAKKEQPELDLTEVKKPIKLRRVISNRLGDIGLPSGIVLKKGIITSIEDGDADFLSKTWFKDFITVIPAE